MHWQRLPNEHRGYLSRFAPSPIAACAAARPASQAATMAMTRRGIRPPKRNKAFYSAADGRPGPKSGPNSRNGPAAEAIRAKSCLTATITRIRIRSRVTVELVGQ